MNCLISSFLRKSITLSTIEFLMINLALGMSVEGDKVLMEKEFTQLSNVILKRCSKKFCLSSG